MDLVAPVQKTTVQQLAALLERTAGVGLESRGGGWQGAALLLVAKEEASVGMLVGKEEGVGRMQQLGWGAAHVLVWWVMSVRGQQLCCSLRAAHAEVVLAHCCAQS